METRIGCLASTLLGLGLLTHTDTHTHTHTASELKLLWKTC